MPPSFRRPLVALILATVAVGATLLPVQAISKADQQIQHNADIRKARNDPKRRVEVHMGWIKAMLSWATADKELQRFVGIASTYREAKVDMEEFTKAQGATDPEVVRVQGEMDALKQQILTAHKSVKTAIFSAPMPADVYRGADKKALLALVKQAWATNYPDEKILAVRFDHPNWHRSHTKDWVSGGNYYRNNDNSVLEVQVIVKKDEELATIFPVFLQKDNDNPSAGAKPGRKLIQEGSRMILLSLVK